jgi:hypothetical protein
MKFCSELTAKWLNPIFKAKCVFPAERNFVLKCLVRECWKDRTVFLWFYMTRTAQRLTLSERNERALLNVFRMKHSSSFWGYVDRASHHNLSNWPILFTNSCFIMSLLYTSTCFEHNCAHHQEVKVVSHSIWHHHILQAAVRCTGWERTAVLSQPVLRCVIQFWPPDDGHNCARNM